MPKNPNAIPSTSAPTWQNWSGNLIHKPASDGVNYYFVPANLADLKSAIAEVAKIPGATIRVSGQRHSQPPLVAGDNRNAVPAKTTEFLVDMSCYCDLGVDQNESIVLGPGTNRVTVNAGVREDALDAFLTQNNLMMKTVTAGGFFSIGGMTAVDVHGGTVNAPIFAETASAFHILLADGTVKTIDGTLPPVNGWSALQFARVSLGGLGIVTSITLDVLPRPSATTLQGGTTRYLLKNKAAFVAQFQQLLTGPSKHDRMEVFYTPYAAAPNLPWVPLPNFLVLWWNESHNSRPENSASKPETACELLQEGRFGAPMLGGLAKYAAQYVRESQYFSDAYDPFHIPPIPPSGYAAIALDEIETQAAAANTINSDLWLTASSQVIFMSYFFEMPNLDAAGLGKVWDGLDVVARRVIQRGNFHIAAPMEFRFVKAGNSAMSGSFSTNPNVWFLNLDLIGFIEPTPAANYPQMLLKFFADVERDWVAMGGVTHNGKMYGFYDPKAAPGTHSAIGAFNPNFLAALRARRGAALTAYSAYRKSMDPKGLFYNSFLRQLLES
jgi:FAD/FMN-containing dehydrogenase